MRYAVAVKQVPDTAMIEVDEDGSLRREGVPSVLNPYDEYALSRILDMAGEEDTVTVYTMGPPQAEEALRRCLDLGADEAFLITDAAFAGSDTWATARALSAFAGRFLGGTDLYVFGRQAMDGDTGQVPYEFAHMVCAQQFAYVDSLETDGDGFLVRQDYGDVRRTCRAPRGSVVSFGSVIPTGGSPRYPVTCAGPGKRWRRWTASPWVWACTPWG